MISPRTGLMFPCRLGDLRYWLQLLALGLRFAILEMRIT